MDKGCKVCRYYFSASNSRGWIEGRCAACYPDCISRNTGKKHASLAKLPPPSKIGDFGKTCECFEADRNAFSDEDGKVGLS